MDALLAPAAALRLTLDSAEGGGRCGRSPVPLPLVVPSHGAPPWAVLTAINYSARRPERGRDVARTSVCNNTAGKWRGCSKCDLTSRLVTCVVLNSVIVKRAINSDWKVVIFLCLVVMCTYTSCDICKCVAAYAQTLSNITYVSLSMLMALLL